MFTAWRLAALRAQAHPELVIRSVAFSVDGEAFLNGREPGPVRWHIQPVIPCRRDAIYQHALFLQGRERLERVNAARAVAGLTKLTSSPIGPRYTVTNCDGIDKRSEHQGVLLAGDFRSTAVDFLLLTDPDGDGPKPEVVTWEKKPYVLLGESGLAAKHRLHWGGHGDAPHYGLPKGTF